ncbi:MAG: DUF4198 domain-containing protein [Pseudomonadota bacterium]
MKLILAVFIAFVATSVSAHEFWIETERSKYDIGEPIVGNLYVGEDASGTALAYLPRNFTAFNFVDGDGSVRTVEGRIGDRPALNIAANSDGLGIFQYETTDSQITWRSSEQFQNFLEYDGLPHIARQHIERGLPPSGFSELFSRHIKALVLVGDGTGEDIKIGMPIEIVALDNPLTVPAASNFDVQVFWQDQPNPDIQVALFHRAVDGSVTRHIVKTDRSGVAQIPNQGRGFYLVSTVDMLPVESGPAVWKSYWASLTFHR